MIRLVNLEKSFDFKVLDKINLDFNPGNIYILKGKSGSGKTTLLNLISGLDFEYSGNIYINDQDLKKMKKDDLMNYHNSIGYMRQNCLLYRNITVLDNLLLIENNKDKIIELCKQFNILDIINKYPYEISGGERERVSLIRALLNDNNILLLDEPSANLDKDNSKNFVKYLEKIDISNKIVIISTHEDLYDDIANVIVNINYGKITIIKNKEVKKGQLKIKKYIGKKDIFKGLKLVKKQNIIFNIFAVVFLLASLLAISFNLKFKNEYIKVKLKEVPYNIIDIEKRYLDDFSKYISDYYVNYVYKDDNLNVYPLYEYENSNLKNYIELGEFPKNNNEVLINYVYANKVGKTVKEMLNTTININDKEYKIVGIISNNIDNFPFIYNVNYSYSEIYNNFDGMMPAIFMYSSELETFGYIDKDDKIMINIKPEYILDLYNNELVSEGMVVNSFAFLQYESEISSISTNVNSITQTSLLIVVVILILTLIFLINQISMELFYQRKEIGYLQLFHYSKDDISLFMTLRYIKDFIISLVISVILYLIICLVLLILYDFNLFISVYFSFSILLLYNY